MRFVFEGMQTSALPGPPLMPALSNDIPVYKASLSEAEIPVDDQARNILTSIQVLPDAFNATFFSAGHIDALHSALLKRVRESLGVRMHRQSDNDLIMIMRSMYMLTRERNIPMADLDALVLRDALESIRSNLQLHEAYLATDDRMKRVMDYGINTNVRGTKTDYF